MLRRYQFLSHMVAGDRKLTRKEVVSMSGGGGPKGPVGPNGGEERCARSYHDQLVEVPPEAHAEIKVLTVGSQVEVSPHPHTQVVQVYRGQVFVGTLVNRELWFCLGLYDYSASISRVRLDEKDLSNSEIWVRSERV